MKVAQASVVTLEYQLNIDGKTVERTTPGKTKTLLIGHETGLPPKLESVLLGRRAGETFVTQVVNGYGEVDPCKIHVVPRGQFPDGATLEVGVSFYSTDETGQTLGYRITAIDGDSVTVDGNHEFAGKKLEYSITIHKIRAAEQVELEHGHVHGEGGVTHHH